MSTLQTTPQHHDRTKTRLGTGALALSTLIALGLALLTLMPANHRAAAPTAGSTALLAAPTAETPAPAGCFRDPATHTLTCTDTAPSSVATQALVGYFRDPVTHKLLRFATKRHPAGRDPVNHSRGRIIP